LYSYNDPPIRSHSATAEKKIKRSSGGGSDNNKKKWRGLFRRLSNEGEDEGEMISNDAKTQFYRRSASIRPKNSIKDSLFADCDEKGKDGFNLDHCVKIAILDCE